MERKWTKSKLLRNSMTSQRRCARLHARMPEAVVPEKCHMQGSNEASFACHTWLSDLESTDVVFPLNVNTDVLNLPSSFNHLLLFLVFILIYPSTLWLHNCCRHENGTVACESWTALRFIWGIWLPAFLSHSPGRKDASFKMLHQESNFKIDPDHIHLAEDELP